MPQRVEGERLYIAQFMRTMFPDGNYALNVPLGPVPEGLAREVGLGKASRIFRPSRRRVDAVAWLPDRYVLVESKLRDPLPALGQLLVYQDLADDTPDLPNYTGQPFELWSAVPFVLEEVEDRARSFGIKTITFQPDWLEEYFRRFQLYFTREYREQRAETQRMRRLLGLE